MAQTPTVVDEYGLEEVDVDGTNEISELEDVAQLETKVQEQSTQQQMAQGTPDLSTVEDTEEEGERLLL